MIEIGGTGQDGNRMTVEEGKTRVTRKECKRERDIPKSEFPWHRKGLWNIAKNKRKPEDRGALPKEEGDLGRAYKGDDHFSSSWLREDAGETAGEVEGKKRRTKGEDIKGGRREV